MGSSDEAGILIHEHETARDDIMDILYGEFNIEMKNQNIKAANAILEKLIVEHGLTARNARIHLHIGYGRYYNVLNKSNEIAKPKVGINLNAVTCEELQDIVVYMNGVNTTEVVLCSHRQMRYVISDSPSLFYICMKGMLNGCLVRIIFVLWQGLLS